MSTQTDRVGTTYQPIQGQGTTVQISTGGYGTVGGQLINGIAVANPK